MTVYSNRADAEAAASQWRADRRREWREVITLVCTVVAVLLSIVALVVAL